MKADTKQLLRDLRAAIMLKHPDSVDLALNGLLALPGVAANDRMPDSTIDQVVLPIGEILASLKAQELRPLLAHPLAIGRAVGGVALAHRLVKQSDTNPNDIQRFARDPRQDVRLALGKALLALSPAHAAQLYQLAKSWLTEPGNRLRHTALIFLPGLVPAFGIPAIHLVSGLDEEADREVRAALVDALVAIARHGSAGPVLDLLALWGSRPQPNAWVICRILSAAWASQHPSEVKSILGTIHTNIGESSEFTNALKALKRHGLEIEL